MTHELNEFDTNLIDVSKKVYKILGRGHRERTYQNALELELRKSYKVIKEYPLPITYEGVIINGYFIDLVIDSELPIEIKATKNIGLSEDLQITNYMKHIHSKKGYLINFGVFELEINKYLQEEKIKLVN